MPYAPPSKLKSLRDRVSAAAEDAGRDPAEITYAYNVAVQIGEGMQADERSVTGGATEVTDRLRSLVEEHELDALNVWIRGRDQRDLFASEVLPKLR